MSASNESQAQGYPAWQWILAVLFFIPLIPMLIATVWTQTRSTLRPARIWAGYFLFATSSFLILIVLIVLLVPPVEEQAAQAVEEKIEPANQVPQPTTFEDVTPVVVSTSAGLGVFRHDIQYEFESLEFEPFSFEEPLRGQDGRWGTYGSTPRSDASLVMRWYPSGYLTKVDFHFYPEVASKVAFIIYVASMVWLLGEVVPTLNDASDFVVSTMDALVSAGGGEHIVYLEGKEIKLSQTDFLGRRLVSLVIRLQ